MITVCLFKLAVFLSLSACTLTCDINYPHTLFVSASFFLSFCARSHLHTHMQGPELLFYLCTCRGCLQGLRIKKYCISHAENKTFINHLPCLHKSNVVFVYCFVSDEEEGNSEANGGHRLPRSLGEQPPPPPFCFSSVPIEGLCSCWAQD